MTLKTLEDLEFEHEWNEAEKPLAVWSDDLKQEAIKWIKFPNDDVGNRRFFKEVYNAPAFLNLKTPSRLMGADLSLARKIIEMWIKHFFNISDEDLK